MGKLSSADIVDLDSILSVRETRSRGKHKSLSKAQANLTFSSNPTSFLVTKNNKVEKARDRKPSEQLVHTCSTFFKGKRCSKNSVTCPGCSNKFVKGFSSERRYSAKSSQRANSYHLASSSNEAEKPKSETSGGDAKLNGSSLSGEQWKGKLQKMMLILEERGDAMTRTTSEKSDASAPVPPQETRAKTSNPIPSETEFFPESRDWYRVSKADASYYNREYVEHEPILIKSDRIRSSSGSWVPHEVDRGNEILLGRENIAGNNIDTNEPRCLRFI